jgi:hypothetical protein
MVAGVGGCSLVVSGVGGTAMVGSAVGGLGVGTVVGAVVVSAAGAAVGSAGLGELQAISTKSNMGTTVRYEMARVIGYLLIMGKEYSDL